MLIYAADVFNLDRLRWIQHIFNICKDDSKNCPGFTLFPSVDFLDFFSTVRRFFFCIRLASSRIRLKSCLCEDTAARNSFSSRGFPFFGWKYWNEIGWQDENAIIYNTYYDYNIIIMLKGGIYGITSWKASRTIGCRDRKGTCIQKCI